MAATTSPSIVTPQTLVELLASDKALTAARKLLDAKFRKQALLRSPNEDTSINGQPLTNALFQADNDAREALEALVFAVRMSAERLAREAME